MNTVMSEILSWDEYFMGVAMLSAQRSKDPSTRVGCCIVSDKRIVAVGYNGMPRGCDDSEFPWGRDGAPLESKYLYVVHAELNAILNATADLRGATLYTSLFPCNECCKAIIQSGISRIVYISDKHCESDAVIAAKRMLDSAGVVYSRFESDKKSISVSLDVSDV